MSHSMQDFSRHFLLRLAILILAGVIAACHSVPPKPTTSLRTTQINELRSVGFAESGDDWLMNIAEPISFDFNEASLKPQFRDTLVTLAQGLQSVGIHELRIDGHTDNVGPRAYNEKLSLDRAEAVAGVFTANGFEKDKVVCRGLAWDFPLRPNTTREGRAVNRRVSIIITGSSLAPSNAKPDDTKPEGAKTDGTKPDNTKPDNTKSDDAKTGDAKTDGVKTD